MKVPAIKIFINLTAAVFIFLFTYTALSKLVSVASFRATLEESPLIKNYASIIVWMLPITELLISLLLFIPASRPTGLYSSFALMTVFTLYIGYMLLFEPKLPCSCGGILQKLTWKQHLGFNMFLTITGGLAIWLHRRRSTQQFNFLLQ